MIIQQKTHTRQGKRKRGIIPQKPTFRAFLLSAHHLKIDPYTFFASLKPWQHRLINYLIAISNKCQEIYPMQETIGQEYVTRETGHLFLHELDRLGFIKIFNRGPNRSCLYMLNSWFYNPANRVAFTHLFYCLKYTTIHYLMPYPFQEEKPSNAERFSHTNNPILSHFPTQDNKLSVEQFYSVISGPIVGQKQGEQSNAPPP